jgi:hypothetical protein
MMAFDTCRDGYDQLRGEDKLFRKEGGRISKERCNGLNRAAIVRYTAAIEL